VANAKRGGDVAESVALDTPTTNRISRRLLLVDFSTSGQTYVAAVRGITFGNGSNCMSSRLPVIIVETKKKLLSGLL